MTLALDKVDPVPAWQHNPAIEVVSLSDSGERPVLGVPIGTDGNVPADVRVSWDALTAAGFTGQVGQALALPGEGQLVIVYGTGSPDGLDSARLRTAVAEYARAATGYTELAIRLPSADRTDPAAMAQAAVEGALLARYAYTPLKTSDGTAEPIGAVTVIADGDLEQLRAGARRGAAYARATALARDLANCPGSVLNAARIAEVAQTFGAQAGLSVEVFDKAALLDLGCGGLLGVNAGSVDEPRMVKLTFRPDGSPRARLTLVGKGIMYDSGGIALKPADAVHATMKNDMSGRGNPGRDERPARVGLPGRRDRLSDVYRQHAVGFGDQARRRPGHPGRHHGRGREHRRRGTAGHG